MEEEPTDICMICGKERPVSCIDTLEKDQTKYLEVSEKTIHFCNDNSSCFFGAEKKRLASKKVEEGP